MSSLHNAPVPSKRPEKANSANSSNHINMLKRLKNAFDPKNILNPGKVFDM
jgi:FAD/FMN-containing dehydrogenase